MTVTLHELAAASRVIRQHRAEQAIARLHAVVGELRRRECASARMAMNKSPLREQLIAALLDRDGVCCGICGEQLELDDETLLAVDVHIDHREPTARGGAAWDVDNLQLAHGVCNQRKGAR